MRELILTLMTRPTFDDINDATGFAQGEPFTSIDQVLDYFTVANMIHMFGPGEYNQKQLDQFLCEVLGHGWHCQLTPHDQRILDLIRLIK